MKTKDFAETIATMPRNKLEALSLVLLGYIGAHPKFEGKMPEEVLRYFTDIIKYTGLLLDDEINVVFY